MSNQTTFKKFLNSVEGRMMDKNMESVVISRKDQKWGGMNGINQSQFCLSVNFSNCDTKCVTNGIRCLPPQP